MEKGEGEGRRGVTDQYINMWVGGSENRKGGEYRREEERVGR